MAYMGTAAEWNDMTRGATHWIDGADEHARAIDLKPVMSGVKTEDEGLFVVQHQYWMDTVKKAIAAEANGSGPPQASAEACAGAAAPGESTVTFQPARPVAASV